MAVLPGYNRPSIIPLNQIIENDQGNFRWSSGGGNFSPSARDIRLTDGGRKIEGELLRDGLWVRSSLILSERIENNDGDLIYNVFDKRTSHASERPTNPHIRIFYLSIHFFSQRNITLKNDEAQVQLALQSI